MSKKRKRANKMGQKMNQWKVRKKKIEEKSSLGKLKLIRQWPHNQVTILSI